jgi:hypothetical protein
MHRMRMQRPTPQRSVVHPLYASIVAALVVVLASTPFLRIPIEGYVATATIERLESGLFPGSAGFSEEIGGAAGQDMPALQQRLLTDERLMAAVRLSSNDAKPVSFETTSEQPSSSLAELRRHLRVSIRENGNALEEVTLQFTSREAETATAFVEQLARQIVASQIKPASEAALTDPDLQRELANARLKEQAALETWEGLLEQQLANFDGKQLAASGRAAFPPVLNQPAGGRSSGSGSQPRATADGPEQENPAWRKLHDRHQALTSRLGGLLVQRTASHPRVLEVSAELGEVSRQLHNTPQFIQSQAAPLNERPGQQTVAAEAQAATLSALQQIAAEHHRLAMEYSAAQQRRAELEQAVSRPNPRAQAAASAWIVRPARICRVQGGGVSSKRVLAAAFLAISLGALLGWLARRPPAPAVIADEASVERLLGLPVVGKVAMAQLAPPPQAPAASV